MSKCNNCRKNEALDTRWERVRRWAFFKLFPEDIINLSQEKFTQGFGDGYKEGWKHANETVDIASVIAEDIVVTKAPPKKKVAKKKKHGKR